MKAFNGLKKASVLLSATLVIFGGSIAAAGPGKACKSFTGAWEGICVKPDGTTESTKFTIYQRACESVAFNGDHFPMNEASMEVSEVKSDDGKTIAFASETYPFWSDFGSVLNVERHIVTVDEGTSKPSHDVRIKETYQIGQGGKLVKEMSVNGQAANCTLSIKP